MRVLVTGGGGFIGSHVSEALLDAGHEVVVLDRDPAAVDPRAELRRADVGDPDAVAAAVAGIDAVCHQAARVGLGVDFNDAPATSETTTWPPPHCSRRWRRGGSKAGWYSPVRWWSMAKGGTAAAVTAPSGPDRGGSRTSRRGVSTRRARAAAPPRLGIRARGHPLDPRSVYAASKLAQEHLCSLWARETGGSVVALRYHNVYGPRLPVDTPYAGVAALFRSSLRRGESPRVFEDGRQTRDFVHVRDVARANLLALSVAQVSGDAGAVNVCSGRPGPSPRWPGRWPTSPGPAVPDR